MRRFNFAEQELIADMATATKWAIEQDMEAGKPMEQAKAARIKQARSAWQGLTPDMRQAVEAVCWSITPADLSRRTHRAVKEQMRLAIETHRGRPLGLFDRVLFNLTGMVW